MRKVPSLFFFNDTATTEIYTLSLHDALPILLALERGLVPGVGQHRPGQDGRGLARLGDVDEADRKSTRLNSSHSQISYAVFCLKKKKTPAGHGSLAISLAGHIRPLPRR